MKRAFRAEGAETPQERFAGKRSIRFKALLRKIVEIES